MVTQQHLRSVPSDVASARDALDEVVIVVGPDGRVVATSGALEPIFGRRSGDVVGAALHDLVGLALWAAPSRMRAGAKPIAANDNWTRPPRRRAA